MKTCSLIIVIFTFFIVSASGKSISREQAETDAKRFIFLRANSPSFNGKAELSLNNVVRSSEGVCYYIFNINTDQGFIIISGDDNVLPVLGYSTKGGFKNANIPDVIKGWLKGYENQISYIIKNKIKASPEVIEAWKELDNNLPVPMSKTNGTEVAPLLKTSWNQNAYYNEMCPSGTFAGCVATAMAQLMKYWNYPMRGSGFHSYKLRDYGTLSANFANTTYHSFLMPSKITYPDTNIAILIYHCGVAVDMQYSSNGSGSYITTHNSGGGACAETALKKYFNYSKKLKGVERSSYSQSDWIALLKNELDSGRPVLYGGFDINDGHAFVCDGYSINSLFHFNWGWGGFNDGFYAVGALNTSSGNWNDGQEAVIGVKPSGESAEPLKMKLYTNVLVGSSVINYGDSINVTANIINNDSIDFHGDVCATIFDLAGNFVDYVSIKKGLSLPAKTHFSSDLSFTDSNSYKVLPGSYNIFVFYRLVNTDWQELYAGPLVASDYASFQVQNTNILEMRSDLNIYKDSFISGETAIATVNFFNTYTDTFSGSYRLSLLNMDGSYAAEIGTLYGMKLAPGSQYNLPLVFSTQHIKASQGNYILALQYKWHNDSFWQFTGAGNTYLNPVLINIKPQPLIPDRYEDNDSVQAAYNLKTDFKTDSNIHIATTGSNFHSGSDKDFYKITLPPGFTYTLVAQIKDVNTKADSFNVAAIYSYSKDSAASWVPPLIDTVKSRIVVTNGGSVYFSALPALLGLTGTYELDVSITRSGTAGIEQNINEDGLTIFPNPVHDFITIRLAGQIPKRLQASIFDMNGNQVYQNECITENNYKIYLSAFKPGVYVLKIFSETGIMMRPLILY